MWKALGAKALVAVLLWPSLAAAEASDAGVVRVGDRWSYDVKDGLTGDLRNQITVVTVDVNEKEITTRASRVKESLPSPSSTIRIGVSLIAVTRSTSRTKLV